MATPLQHIIWLCPGFAADESDDTCIPPLQLLARSLQAEPGIQLHIITLHYPAKRKPYRFHGSWVYPCARLKPLAKVRSWLWAYQTARTLLKHYPQAFLHSFWLNDAAMLGHWLHRQYRLPHLVTLMGQDARTSNRYLRVFPIPKMELICLSAFHRDTLQAQYPKLQVKLIPWGIPASEITPSLPIIDRPYDVIGIGSLISLKAYRHFVEVIKQLQPTNPNIRALLIGDGPQREELEQLIEKLNLADHLQLVGKRPRQEVLTYLRQAKVFLHTSTYESFGYVLIEALAQGTAVVSTPVGIAPEIPQLKTGRTVQELSALVAAQLSSNTQATSLSSPYLMEYTTEQYLAHYLAAK